ncbi:MAG: hypothetical protein INQ03_05715 [Candidatus Heimdallarchaeota archaeon]|nr:hypothetical protein [Candidatus Heimdallarchaeota archaeon]
MSKRTLMKFAVNNVLSEVVSNLPNDKAAEVEQRVESDLAKKLGDEWTDLPVTGPTMLVLFVILNYTLLPLGVTPATITDSIISKVKEHDIDDKAIDLLDNVKSGIKTSGEYSSEKLNELTEYVTTFADNSAIGTFVKTELKQTSNFISTGISGGIGKSKSLFKKLKEKIDPDEE